MICGEIIKLKILKIITKLKKTGVFRRSTSKQEKRAILEIISTFSPVSP